MAAILLNATGMSFGLTTETGGLIQNLEVVEKREKAVVRDNQGATTAKSYYDPTFALSYELYPTGTTGLAAASAGVAVTVANYTPASGAIYTEEVTTSRPNTDFKKISVKAEICPAIS